MDVVVFAIACGEALNVHSLTLNDDFMSRDGHEGDGARREGYCEWSVKDGTIEKHILLSYRLKPPVILRLALCIAYSTH